MNIYRSFALVASVLAGASSLAACSSEEAKTDDVESVRSAICNGNGGGGGDACSNTNGFCPAECSYCFTSDAERIRLQNLWECNPTNGGGGGGGSGGGCSNAFIRAAQQDCRDSICPNYSPTGHDTCAGIHSCTVNGNGTNTYVCACGQGPISRVGDTF